MIKIFTTGGTIDKIYNAKSATLCVGEPSIINILHQANIALDYEVQSILKKDSLEITDKERRMVFEYIRNDQNNHIILVHGTDSMIKTAKLISEISGKVIVIVGAMKPAVVLNSDACFNVGFAISAVQILPTGVYIAMNGRIFKPDSVEKNLTDLRFEKVGDD